MQSGSIRGLDGDAMPRLLLSCLRPVVLDAVQLAGTKLGGNERGGNSLA